MAAATPDGSAPTNALVPTWSSFDAPGPNSHCVNWTLEGNPHNISRRRRLFRIARHHSHVWDGLGRGGTLPV